MPLESQLILGSLEMSSLTPGALDKVVVPGVVGGQAAPGAVPLAHPPGGQGAISGDRTQVVISGDQTQVVGINGVVLVGQGPGGVAGLAPINGVGEDRLLGVGTSGTAGEIRGKEQDQELHGTGTIRDRRLGRVRLGLDSGAGQGLGPTGTGVRQQQLAGGPRPAHGSVQQPHNPQPHRHQQQTLPSRPGPQHRVGPGLRVGLEAHRLGRPRPLTQSSPLLTG